MSTTLDEANREITLLKAERARLRNALYTAEATLEQAKRWRWWAPVQKLVLAHAVAEIQRVMG